MTTPPDPASPSAHGLVDAAHELGLIRLVVEQMSDGVVITDAQLAPPGPRIVYINPAFTRITGWEARDIIGKTPRILQGPKTDRRVIEHLRQAVRESRASDFETYNYRRNGEPYLNQWRIAPLKDAQGAVTHWVSIQRDVTERRRQEELAHVRENELAHAGRLSAMGELASGLAHELNQPLAAIANFSRGAVRRMDAPVGLSQAQVRQTLTKVADQAERAGEIIRRIRRFVVSREPQHGEFSLTESAQGVLEMIGYELRARSIDAVVTADPQTPAVFGDAVQIEQVILNLLTNAMDAVVDRPGAGRIDLRVGPAEGPSRARGARVEVVDDGAGIPDDVRDHVFEPFFTTKPNGVGVGLVISQSIVIAHRGRLDTAPNPPHGTRVSVWLPCRAV